MTVQEQTNSMVRELKQLPRVILMNCCLELHKFLPNYLMNFPVLSREKSSTVHLSQAREILTIATIATDKFTLIAYKQKNPKKAHIART